MRVVSCLLWNRLGMWLHCLALFMWVPALKNLLFFCSHLPEIIAFQIEILSWEEVWIKVLLKAVCVLGTWVWGRSACKGRLQNWVIKERSSHLLHCLSFDIEVFMLFQFLEPPFPVVHTNYLLVLNCLCSGIHGKLWREQEVVLLSVLLLLASCE